MLSRCKKTPKKLKIAGAVIAALAVIILLSLLYTTPYLVLTNDHSGRILLVQRINEGDEFAVSFIHSVNISPVQEIYQVQQGQIVLTALEFYAFGAGMPTDLEAGQTLVHLPAGGMRIEGFERTITDLRYMVDYIADLTLHLGAKNISLASLDAPGQPIRFNLKQLTIWQRVFCFYNKHS